MPKVSYTAGFTLHLGDPSRNEYIRQTVEVHDIDTDVDVIEQLKKVHETLYPLMKWTDEVLVSKIEQELKMKLVKAE